MFEERQLSNLTEIRNIYSSLDMYVFGHFQIYIFCVVGLVNVHLFFQLIKHQMIEITCVFKNSNRMLTWM